MIELVEQHRLRYAVITAKINRTAEDIDSFIEQLRAIKPLLPKEPTKPE